ncbi:L-serine dehydratase/L-threonine deaminase [Paracoccidioides brasiliensis Pb18]|uniref:L-serine dehydratase/L-threonine deaminase n=1 Tax=Paracoccidioides brasiliensis (strain Pb18) TaxID=502780 RepID=C1GA28_PARBD|nr:L-serine dehydratase/L-threonine deaminase [Paracoccidioides brasiliensis Pb18]EEH48030.2 L-serine dehydratase/L-threonine deaminase [Paracoccidioides brasiliensis Pb18]
MRLFAVSAVAGLMNGIIQGIERQLRMAEDSGVINPNQGKDVQILALETKGAESLAKAVERGELVSLKGVSSMATSLAALRVAERTLQNVLNPPAGVKVHNRVMDDAEAAKGVLRLVDEHRLLVELACGVCVEAVVAGGQTQGLTAHANTGQVADEPVEWSSKLAQIIPGFGPQSRVVVIVCGGSNISLETAVEYRERLNNEWGTGNE